MHFLQHYEADTMRSWDMFNIFIRKARQVSAIDSFPVRQRMRKIIKADETKSLSYVFCL